MVLFLEIEENGPTRLHPEVRFGGYGLFLLFSGASVVQCNGLSAALLSAPSSPTQLLEDGFESVEFADAEVADLR